MSAAGGSVADRYMALDQSNQYVGFQPKKMNFILEPNGYALRPLKKALSESTGVFIVGGQSNAAGFADTTAFSPANPNKIDSFSAFNGQMYEAKEHGPHMDGQPTGSNWLYRTADALITAGKYQRVIMVPVAVGGTFITDHLPGGYASEFIKVAALRLMDLNIPITGIIWQQGESDTQAGTTQADYRARLNQVIARVRAIGCTAPWLIGKSTWNVGVTSPAIRAAIDQVIGDNTSVFLGADTDTITTANRDATLNTHFNSSGLPLAAALWTARIQAVL